VTSGTDENAGDRPVVEKREISGLTFNLDVETILEKLRDLGLFIQDLEHGKVYPNKLWEEWGYREEDMAFGNFIRYVHLDDQQKVREAVESLDAIDEPYNSVLFRFRTADGSWRWILSTSLTVTRDDDGKLLQYIGFDYDLTDQAEARQRAERSAREAETLASAAAIINSELDLKHTIGAILEQAYLVLPFASASVQLLGDGYLEIVGGKGFGNASDIVGLRFPIPGNNPNTALIDRREPLILDTDLRDRFPRFIEITNPNLIGWMGVPLINRDEVIGMMTFDRDREPAFSKHELAIAKSFANHVAIALQNARLYEDMRALSIRDGLTGCYNRRWMYELMEQQMDLSIRHGQELSLIMYDLDDFKGLNDNYGHLFGDRVLKTVTDIARGMLRKTDSLCRYGGEEFIIILPQTDEAAAFEIAERIRIAILEHRWFPDSDDSVTLSLGCASMQISDVKHQESFLSRVDTALLRSKADGKNRCTRYTAMN
jgi:diguanylate cyclase (GGDEF)-like protein/PAS domain S-box-containing protein